ncbi:MAG: mechanosensitive ion channel family protein [Candidatus Saccharibacteria bacterium]
MPNTSDINSVVKEVANKLTSFHALFIILIVFAGAYIFSRLIAKLIISVAQKIALRSDTTSDEERSIKLRRIETYLSVTIATVRGIIFAVGAYVVLKLLLPDRGALVTTIGAGTFFVVFANATIAPLLRDVTSGVTMIVERWFSVGDFIRVEPFMDVGGVVERATLRSTKLRNINGEIIWLHNQYIQGVRITPRGLRTMAIDIFVRDLKAGRLLVKDIASTLPTSPTMLASPLVITNEEEIANDLWRITIMGQTAPGREWLIEKFTTEALKDADHNKKTRVIVYGPLVRFADKTAEKRFKRAVRVNRTKN